jgi:hypothetical protein
MKSDIVSERFSVIAENITFKKVIFDIAEKLHARKPRIEAKSWMLAIGWRIDWCLATIFKTKRRLSKYGSKALFAKDPISNTKIKNTLNFEFQRIESVIDEVARLYQK